MTGRLLNDGNFYGEGSVEDFNRQLVTIVDEIEDNQTSILECNDRIRVLNREKEILEDSIKKVG